LYGNGIIQPCPPYLKKILRKGTYIITLGTWSFLIEKLQEKNQSIEDELKEYIENNFTADEINIIKEACDFLGRHRGGPAHTAVESKQSVLQIRNEIIPHLNKIINLFYKGPV